MATLSGKTVLIIGGSSGIGYGVAKASLLSLASKVVIASSNATKVDSALGRLKDELSALGKNVEGILAGDVVDGKDSASVKALLERVGELDHLVWTSGDALRAPLPELDLDKNRDVFDLRFWGSLTAAKFAKVRTGGSITFTVGQLLVKPVKGFALTTGIAGAVDSLTRGLAVDLAPIRVNVISPGLVLTEMWDPTPPEAKERYYEMAKKQLVPHVGMPDEIAEAYLFCMKCSYITGQRIEVDGGYKYI